MLENYLDFPLDQLETRMLIGDQKAIAYSWIQAYASGLVPAQVKASGGSDDYDDGYEEDDYWHEPVSANELFNAFQNNDYIIRGGLFEGESVDPMFYTCLKILMEDEYDSDNESNLFSCSC